MKKENETVQHLDEHGIIFLWGLITDGTAEVVCRQILEANIRPGLRRIQMIINSGGGSCQAGFAIIDMMEWSRLPVHTAGFGIVGSMAAMVFAAGAQGHRVVTPSTALLVHHFSSLGGGTYPDLMSKRKYEDFLYERIVTHLTRYSALKTENEVLRQLLHDSDTWLTPAEAVQFGLADTIQAVGPERSA